MCSGAGTAQWQYVLPNKRKSKSGVQLPVAAFHAKASEILKDVEYAQRNAWSSQGTIILTDARVPVTDLQIQTDAVITSPPYPNNYDYADATRLEMTFWGEINGWGDLQNSVRRHLIRSCSQHAAAEKLVLDDLLAEPVLEPIRKDLSIACRTLAEVRETKGGRKAYHTMAAAYFRDLGLVFKSLRPLCRSGGVLCFVIGDSAPYGVMPGWVNWLLTQASSRILSRGFVIATLSGKTENIVCPSRRAGSGSRGNAWQNLRLISFTNGDRVEGSFKDKAKVREFLQFIAKQ